MKRVPLGRLAFARSGDKGRVSNVGVVAFDQRCYLALRELLTAEVVAHHFRSLAPGRVERYELPNLRALNFVLPRALGEGATTSLRTDAQGKAFGLAALTIELELPDDFPLPEAR